MANTRTGKHLGIVRVGRFPGYQPTDPLQLRRELLQQYARGQISMSQLEERLRAVKGRRHSPLMMRALRELRRAKQEIAAAGDRL